MAAAVALAVWLLVPPSPRTRLRRVVQSPVSLPTSRQVSRIPVRRIAAWSLGIGVAVLLSSAWGAVVGLVLALAADRLLDGFEPRAQRERRERLQAQVPDACDLLSAMLASGAPVDRAVDAVASAIGPPTSDVLGRVVAALRLGLTPHEAWRHAAQEPALARISEAFERSSRTGAPLAEVLRGLAHDERQRSRRDLEVAARSAGVRAVGPLAACFLPAFVLLGVVPVVASMAGLVISGS